MPTIIFSPTAQVQQIEDFPADVERTVEGAIYVRPGATAVVSEGEAAHLTSKGIVFSVAGKRARMTPPTMADVKAATAAPAKPAAPAPKLPPLSPTPLMGGATAGSQGGSEQK